jgi:uncharacterized protein (DUF2147 family)
MRKFATTLALALAVVGTVAAAAQAPAESPMYGVWLNHKGNVKVETKPCGQYMCGTVVWASPDALKEARDSGTDNLVGLQLMRQYHPTTKGEWEGSVFVPDLKRTFYSRLYRLSDDKIRISGCILGGLLCKYQTWTRQ